MFDNKRNKNNNSERETQEEREKTHQAAHVLKYSEPSAGLSGRHVR